MKWFKRRQAPSPPPRVPDNDPVTEAHLQRLDELVRQISFKREQITGYQAEIELNLKQIRDFAAKAASAVYTNIEEKYKTQIAASEARITRLQAEIRQLEADINTNHERIIAERTALKDAEFNTIQRFIPPKG